MAMWRFRARQSHHPGSLAVTVLRWAVESATAVAAVAVLAWPLGSPSMSVALAAPPEPEIAASDAEAHRAAPTSLPLESDVGFAAAEAAIASLLAPAIASRATEIIRLRAGDSLAAALSRAGVAGEDQVEAVRALAAAIDLRTLRAGQEITLYLDRPKGEEASARLVGMALPLAPARMLHLAREHDGRFRARDFTETLRRRIARASGTITESLYADAVRAGAHDATIAEIASLLAYSVDFQREIMPGDTFDIVFEEWVDEAGRPAKAGALYYVGFTPSGRSLAYWRFEGENGEPGYFDAKGESAKRFLMKTPINGARLSSGFGKRRHPVLGYTKMHKGTDFAAPPGTPIYAAGEGVIERADRYGGYGNYIRIRHANGYKTAYAHLSRFAKGMRAGKRVRQGQVIGFVGSTGRSTGPHLHYEVLKNNAQVNPMTIKAPTGRMLAKVERPAFDVERALIDALRDRAEPAGAPASEAQLAQRSAPLTR